MNLHLHAYWRALANGDRHGKADRLLLATLGPVSLAYAMAQRLRASLYQQGVLKCRRLPRPVISIGNLTVGGTGKTPVTAHIARLLLNRGYKVAVLSRGYGGSLEGHASVVSDGASVMLQAEQCGDEPYLLASTIPGLMVATGSDRYEAGMLAMERLNPDIFLLDDGFQHLRLMRDLNILLLDHTRPFGNGWTLPGGLLREPPAAAERADLVIKTRCSENTITPGFYPDAPYCGSRHRLLDAVPLCSGPPLKLERLRDQRLLAFAGIAEPERFFADLRHRGLNLAATLSLPDHCAYNGEVLDVITSRMASSKAGLCITTEKDGVKLSNAPDSLKRNVLLARLGLELDHPEILERHLLNLLQKQTKMKYK